MPLLVWAVVLTVQGRSLPDPRLRLDMLQLLVSEPGDSDASGQAVGKSGLIWYQRSPAARTDFTLRHQFTKRSAGDKDLLALYVPSVERNVEVFLNGTKIGDGGRLEPPVERNRHRPLLFTIPSGLVHGSDNALDLRVVSDVDDPGFIPPVYFGPREALEPAYRRNYFFKVTSIQMILVTILFLVLFIGGLWRRRPRETVYAWFAAGLVFWSVYNLNYLLTRYPVSIAFWQAIIHAALGGFLYSMILFVHRLVGVRRERLERALLWLTAGSIAVMAVGAAILDVQHLWILINSGYRWILLALGTYLVVQLLVLSLRRRTSTLYWLWSATAVTFSFGVHDSLRQLGVLDPTVPGLMQYGELAALLVFGYLAVDRFARALSESEELNVALDGKVQEKTRALEEQFERTRVLEREMVLAGERERLVRDMHDGMGGQMVTLLTLVRTGQSDPRVLEEGLTECLHDLRLMIDSMDTAGEDLGVGLAMFRARLEPRLQAMGLEVHWELQRLPEGVCLGPEGVLHVFRILQESIQNAVKHAHARTLWIEARADGPSSAPGVLLTVRDDGVGLDPAAPHGRGLTNMRRRAAEIDATLTVDAAHPGTRVTLSLAAATAAR